MNDYDLIAEQIEEINIKLKEIDKQMIIVEDIKPQFSQMDTFIPDLEAAYKDFDNSLSNSIFKTQELHGNPLQYSCLENARDRGAWRATVHRVTKRQTHQK